MNKNRRNCSIRANRIVGHFAAEKKKTILAVCLIALMAFMWIKVFAAKGPETAEAAMMNSQAGTNLQSKTEAKVSFIELPEISGRTDVITRDIFASNGWRNFVNTEKNVVLTREVKSAGDGSEKVIESIAGNMRLEAIVMGENPRALINNKILSAGDILPVNDGAESYDCEVILIDDDSVVMRCEKAEVTLKLKQIIEKKNQS